MAFFDELSKKLSEVGQSAVQKGKEVADIAKYTASIAEEERNIRNLYSQIGQEYVKRHGDSAEPDMQELIQKIWDAQEKIQENRRIIRDIKGVVLCSHCEAEVDKDAQFCSKCGEKIVREEPVAEEPVAEAEVVAEVIDAE